MMVSGGFDVYTTRKNRMKIKEMASYSVPTTVKRDGAMMQLDSVELLPGDVVALPTSSDWKLPCDLVLISGLLRSTQFVPLDRKQFFRHLPIQQHVRLHPSPLELTFCSRYCYY